MRPPARSKGRKALAAKTGISEQQLLEWANVSDYMRIPGMGKAKVGLVRAAGVTTVRELALRNPARLAQNMKDVNTKRKLVRVLPSEKSVEQLIEQGSQASAQDHLLRITFGGFRAAPADALRILTPMQRTAQSDRMIATTSRPATAATPADHPALRALLSRPYPAVMGVLNITPNSFSDGGQFIAPESALAQARRMIAEGADIIDIGAESTRPYGSQPVSADEELRRLQPVLADVVVARRPRLHRQHEIGGGRPGRSMQVHAIANDVWGLQRDPDMARLVAARHSPVIVMHNRDQRRCRHRHHEGHRRFLRRARWRSRTKAGIPRDNIVLDPGIGFGKTPEQSMTALARLDELGALRPAAAGRRVAQALHQHGHRRRSRTSGSAARSRRI